jgi:hypothetical protein
MVDHTAYDARYSADLERESTRWPPLGRDIIEGCVEVVARITDAAEHVVNAGADADPRYGARTSGDVVRQSPAFLERATYALNDSLRDVNESVTDLLDIRAWERGGRRRRTRVSRDSTAPATASEADLVSEEEVVVEARYFVNRGRYRGATLSGLVRHLRSRTSWSDDQLEAVIARHFVVEDDLVLPAGRASTAADLPDSIEDHLRALGYDDLRRNVRLERLDDTAPPAELVAYHADQPSVIVHRVSRGHLVDAVTIENARFQAKALSQTATPEFIYLTDGTVNRYFSIAEDRIVTELPKASGGARKAK